MIRSITTSRRDARRVSSSSRPWAATCVLLAIGVQAVMSGCSKGLPYETGTVSGMVTIDGQPVPRGAITFAPTDNGHGPVTGGTITEGKFRCELVPVGKHKVTFVAQAAEMRKFTDATGAAREVPQDILPAKYREGIPTEVAAGESTRDFSMQNK